MSKVSVAQKVVFCLILFLLISLTPNPSLSPTFAQTCTTTTARAEGLVTSPQVGATSKFGTSSGACVVDPKAVFTPYKVPTYDDLKSLYFDQAKTSDSVTKHDPLLGDKTHSDIPMTTGNDHLYYIKKTTATDGNLTISGNIPGNQTGVVFVDGNLNIGPIPGNQLTYGDASGLVFLVKGNVNISQSITRIDAVIISEGTICTAFDGIVCPGSNVTLSQLVINGSLISLSEAAPIKFRRALANNIQAAEKINHQVKYLVILRNLMSDTFQRWSETP